MKRRRWIIAVGVALWLTFIVDSVRHEEAVRKALLHSIETGIYR